MKPAQIPSLTPLRGIAAIMVLMFHFHLLVAPLHDPAKYALISKWYLLVDLFFVLSGFIIYHVYGNYFKNGWHLANFKKYLWARFARIYPLHFFTLLYAIGLYLALKYHQVELNPIEEHILDPKAIPTSLLLIQAWGMHLEAPWNTPSWSISVEWFVYLLFPFLIAFFWSPLRKKRFMLAIACFIVLVVVIYIWQPYNFSKRQLYLGDIASDWLKNRHTIDVITGPALLRGLVGFIIGLFAYHFYKNQWGQSLLSKGIVWFPLWIMLFMGWTKAWLPDLLAIYIFGILVLSTAYLNGKMQRILNTGIPTYLGDISYSIYLTHMLIIFTLLVAQQINPPPEAPLPDMITRWIMLSFFLLLTIGISSLTYFFIEKPIRKYLNKQSQKLTQLPTVRISNN